ncbi:MAG: LysR family transcriptional regulator [Eubacterium sp.]|nr:LysR family transcriptional regulator [Eubacterium sp.]MCM1417913.1 LysR family transcriptional regulator [Roseburia sp.]
MTRASESLHVSQPSLSKEMKALEEELGKKLFIRKNGGVSLTDEGMLLRKRAEDIVEMTEKTVAEFNVLDEINGGEIYIGCAESYLIKYLARAVKKFTERYPFFRYHLLSGNTVQVAERLDRGLLDMAFIAEPPDLSKYNYLEVCGADVWGVLMRRDSPLAKKETLSVEDLYGLSLICSDQAIAVDIPRWCGERAEKLTFAGTLNLCYNGSVFVREGLGYMLTFDKLADTSEESGLCFRPLNPPLETRMYIIWKKYQIFSTIAEKFLTQVSDEIDLSKK